MYYAKAFGDLLQSAGKAPVTFSRAGFTGSQSHGTFWAGNENSIWEAFRWSLFTGLSAASSGILPAFRRYAKLRERLAPYLATGACRWIDAWTGSATSGGRIVVRPVPIDEIPIYVRASAWSELAQIFAD